MPPCEAHEVAVTPSTQEPLGRQQAPVGSWQSMTARMTKSPETPREHELNQLPEAKIEFFWAWQPASVTTLGPKVPASSKNWKETTKRWPLTTGTRSGTDICSSRKRNSLITPSVMTGPSSTAGTGGVVLLMRGAPGVGKV